MLKRSLAASRSRLALAGAGLILAGACIGQATPSPTPSATATPTVVAESPTPTPPPPTPSPSPAPTPSQEPTEHPSVCTGRDPNAQVYSPQRRTVLQLCVNVNGVVASVTHQADGDTRLVLTLDYGYESVLSYANLSDPSGQFAVKIVCTPPIGPEATDACRGYTSAIAIPAVGAHIQATGPLVRDVATGQNLIQPAYVLTPLLSPPVAAPKEVQDARSLWTQIRQKWPAIPPAIVLADDFGAIEAASASLQPDGIAHVFVGRSATVHDVWHEAGHILHAAAMRARGHTALLFTVQDDVGIAYWSARGYPGLWGDHLVGGNWGTIAYEELAESFAAVNLGDAERTFTYGVPLDRGNMLAFFVSIAPLAR